MKKLIVGVLLLVAAAGAAVFLLSSPEEKVIEALLRDGLAAAKRGDADAVLAIFSKDYKSSDDDHAGMVARVRRTLREPWLQTVGIREAGIHVDGAEAQANVAVEMRAGVQVVDRGDVRIRLRKEPEGWRILSVDPVR